MLVCGLNIQIEDSEPVVTSCFLSTNSSREEVSPLHDCVIHMSRIYMAKESWNRTLRSQGLNCPMAMSKLVICTDHKVEQTRRID